MNERTKLYLDKIVNYLVEDTRIESAHPEMFYLYGEKMLIFAPFWGRDNFSNWNYFLENEKYPVIYFVDYLVDVYGVTPSECKYVWVKYIDMLKEMVKNFNSDMLTENMWGNNKVTFDINSLDAAKITNVNIKNKLERLLVMTIDGVMDSMVVRNDESNNIITIQFREFKDSFGLYLDGNTEKAFLKFSETYTDYILKQMMDLFKDYIMGNHDLAVLGLIGTDMLLKRIKDTFVV